MLLKHFMKKVLCLKATVRKPWSIFALWERLNYGSLAFLKDKYARRVSELRKFTSLFCTKFVCASSQQAKERAVICQGVSSAPKTPLLLCRVCLYVCTELLSSATFNNSSFTAPREGVFVALCVSIVSSARRKQTEMSFC